MLEDLRKHLDIIMVILAALVVYHFVLKARGVQGGIAASARMG